MRVIFHQRDMFPISYHRGFEIQNGRYYGSDCKSHKETQARYIHVDLKGEGSISFPIMRLCGNCFKEKRNQMISVTTERIIT